jgi:hypothetical protein
MQQEKKYIKAIEIKEMYHIEPGHKIKLYGEETIVVGFYAAYNEGLEKFETIILTEGGGWPFERSLNVIEVLPDQPWNMPLQKNGAVWVRASEFNYEVGVAYHAKDSASKGAGKFDSYGQFIWGDATVTLPRDWEGLYILDESGQSKQRDKIDRDWITGALVQFALLYHQSKNIANDAVEYLNDKLKDAGIEYVLSEDEREVSPLTQERADFIREANGRDLGGVEGNKKREMDFAHWLSEEGYDYVHNIGWMDERDTVLTDEQLWNEWNNQQQKT